MYPGVERVELLRLLRDLQPQDSLGLPLQVRELGRSDLGGDVDAVGRAQVIDAKVASGVVVQPVASCWPSLWTVAKVRCLLRLYFSISRCVGGEDTVRRCACTPRLF